MDKIHVDEDTGCWVWQASLKSGYGRFEHDRVAHLAHRWAFTYWKGEIADGLQVDHLCRNRACVFPGHLQAVTPDENVRRSMNPTALNSRKTHCLRGHELAGDNVRIRPGGSRICRTCEREHSKEWRVQNPEKYAASQAKYQEGNVEQRRTSARESMRRVREKRAAQA